jgi:hypothetical protein
LALAFVGQAGDRLLERFADRFGKRCSGTGDAWPPSSLPATS